MPSTRYAQHAQLDQSPPHDPGVDGFALVTEFGFSLLWKIQQMINMGQIWAARMIKVHGEGSERREMSRGYV